VGLRDHTKKLQFVKDSLSASATPGLGNWYIGRVNLVLAGVQFLLWFQAASRGLDYVQPRPDSPVSPILLKIEETLPLPVWGTGYLIAALVLFIGVSGRWWHTIVAGHALCAVMYFCFTAGTMAEVDVVNGWLAAAGLLVLLVGVYLSAVTLRRDWWRFGGSIVFTAVGGWGAGLGLGYDFRTSSAFLVGTLGHLFYALGIAWLATRGRQTPLDGVEA